MFKLILPAVAVGLFSLFISTSSLSYDEKADVLVRVVDVGAGLCTITKVPDENGGHLMVYDAGGEQGKEDCIKAVRELIGKNNTIELLIISHSDADHLWNADELLEEISVRQIIRTGYRRETDAWKALNYAIAQEAFAPDISIINLQTHKIKRGTEFKLGEATVTFIAGWPGWEELKMELKDYMKEDEIKNVGSSVKRNAVSIVVRLEFKNRSVLFTGDTIGRTLNDKDDACKLAEMIMVKTAEDIPIISDVMIAPHHGANNGSSSCFIKAVKPKFVIFSAGHKHRHPTKATAKRYLDFDIEVANMFRTDLGDHEKKEEREKEKIVLKTDWGYGRIKDCKDKSGDDDIDIVLSSSGEASVAYRCLNNRETDKITCECDDN